MITPKKDDFTLYQGATWEHTFEVRDAVSNAIIDITGCTAKLQAREDVDSADTVLDLVGQIGGVNGQVKFTVTPAMTIDKTWEKAGYDAELTWPSSKVDKLGIGKFKLFREYTTS